MAILMYGGGLRVTEAATLRVKDVDVASRAVTVRLGKGGKDRMTVLPERLVEPMTEQLEEARRRWRQDLADPRFAVALPDALARQVPDAACQLPCYWVFPARECTVMSELVVRVGIICTRPVFTARWL